MRTVPNTRVDGSVHVRILFRHGGPQGGGGRRPNLHTYYLQPTPAHHRPAVSRHPSVLTSPASRGITAVQLRAFHANTMAAGSLKAGEPVSILPRPGAPEAAPASRHTRIPSPILPCGGKGAGTGRWWGGEGGGTGNLTLTPPRTRPFIGVKRPLPLYYAGHVGWHEIRCWLPEGSIHPSILPSSRCRHRAAPGALINSQ